MHAAHTAKYLLMLVPAVHIMDDYHRLTIIRLEAPTSGDVNDVLQWFATSLGLFSLRDKERSTYRIFIELLKAARQEKEVSSDHLAKKLGLTRATVIHHLNKLHESGIIRSQKNRYRLRVKNLTFLVDEIEKDIKRTMEDLKEVAGDLDQRMGL